MSFKLPSWTRPYLGSIVGSVATVASAVILQKVPILTPYINPETITGTVMAYLAAHLYGTAVNAKINPTQAATPALAASVPATTVDKHVGTVNLNAAPPVPVSNQTGTI